jgi:hypothetical protein
MELKGTRTSCDVFQIVLVWGRMSVLFLLASHCTCLQVFDTDADLVALRSMLPPATKRVLEAAVRAYTAGDWAAAYQLFFEAVVRSPGTVDHWREYLDSASLSVVHAMDAAGGPGLQS